MGGKMRKLVIALLVICVAVGASVGVVLGSGSTSSTAIKASALNTASVPMHRVATPSASASTAAKRARKQKLIYLESNVFTLRHGDNDGATGTCPRHSKGINGYFGTDTPGVVPTYDAVGNSPRKWSIVVINMTDTNARVFLGTVCLKL
jgi:hypothetical protein